VAGIQHGLFGRCQCRGGQKGCHGGQGSETDHGVILCKGVGDDCVTNPDGIAAPAQFGTPKQALFAIEHSGLRRRMRRLHNPPIPL